MAHNCITYQVSVPNDTTDRKIARIIENNAAGNRKKINTMMTFFIEGENDTFKVYLFNNISDEEKQRIKVNSSEDLNNENIAKINGNTLKSIVNKYYRTLVKDIDNYDSKEANDALEGFSSHRARYIAKTYCATKILELYHSNESIDKISSKLRVGIHNEFITSYVNPLLNNILNGDSYHFTQKHKDLAIEIKKYNNRLKEIKDRIDFFKKKEKLIEAENTELANIRKEQSELLNNRHVAISVLHKSVPPAFSAFKNFGNLFDIISTPDRAAKWYEEVFRLKRLVNGKNLFKVLTEEEKQYESVIEDEDSFLTYDNTDSIDLYAKSWSEAIAKSYEQNVANDVKLYLSSIYEVNSPISKNDTEEDIDFYYDSELGTKSALSPEFLIQQISNLNFTSQEDFLNAVYEASQSVPELYSLGVLYIRMKNNPILLNRIFTELNQNKLYKIQSYVTNNGNNIQLSNREINNVSDILYKLVTSAINTYKTSYLESDTGVLFRTLNRLESIYNNKSSRENTINYLLDYVSKYFNSIPVDNFRNYLYKPNLSFEEFKEFVNAINEFQKQIKVIKAQYQTAFDTYDEKKKAYNKELKKRQQEEFYGIEHKDQLIKPKLDLSNVNYDTLYDKLLPVAKLISKTTLIDNQLNSYNAENNMSSDLLPNSRITNIIKQLAYEHKDSKGNITQVGLEKLKQFITNPDGSPKPQYRHSNLFFGSGNTKGIFTLVDEHTITINKEAKDLIRVSLFDGIKDKVDNKGVLYEGMSKGDYFMTMLETFHKGINFYDNSHTNKGGYFMRTPSDAPKNFIIQTTKFRYSSLVTPTGINKNSDFFKAFKNIVLGEITNFIEAIELLSVNGIITNEIKEKYFAHYHYNKREGIIKDGKLTGNVFQFIKLPEVNGFDVNKAIQDALSLYGGKDTHLLHSKNDTIEVNSDILNQFKKEDYTQYNEELDNVIEEWIKHFIDEVSYESQNYLTIIDNKFNTDEIKEAMLNYVIAYNKFDELFEGDSKFYADARTFLKRAKEAQAGGKSYAGFTLNDSIGGEYIEGNSVFTQEGLNEELYNIKARNGFKAVTITNTIKPSKYADNLEKELYDSYIKQGYTEEKAKESAKQIADKYRGKTKTNDAQSYITIEEFIRREYAKGTLSNYTDLLNQIYNLKEQPDGSYDTSSIDLNKINARIQVQKNFYYDIVEDSETKLHYPRQIKNAEFVLIPQLLPANSSLRKLYDIMKRNGIDQINTEETSKAAKKNVLVYWDNDGTPREDFEEQIKRDNVINTYYYRNLYKQQDTPSHLKDKRNKAGIQIMKKVLDNYHTASDEVKAQVKRYFDAYSANIKDSFYTFITEMGWKYDERTDSIVNLDGSDEIKFDKYYELARNEAVRLGLDSNFIDYLVPTNNGKPIMPSYMNNVSTKLESIAQSLFNNHVTRQTLPGWHCAQITNIGWDKELKFHKDRYVKKGTTIIITEEEYNNLSDEDKQNYESAAVVDVMIPRWSNMIPKDYSIEKLRKEGLTIQVGYRIPTEGKQSICIFNVVDFIDDIYDSTIVVPDEWVEQTGSDMDGDSVYGIIYPMEWKYENGDRYLSRVEPNLIDDEENTHIRYEKYIKQSLRKLNKTSDLDLLKNTPKESYISTLYMVARENNLNTFKEFSKKSIIEQNTTEQREAIIVDSMIKILLDYSSREENLSGSTFENLKDSMNKYDAKRNKANAIKDSAYNPFTQLLYMENAMSGARLKARSVNRDTFNSVCNVGKAVLNRKYQISVKYPVEEIDADNIVNRYGNDVTIKDGFVEIRHNKWAWSNDNKNVIGKIITSYSSQTTAHILDAIKEGTIYNENEFTFGAFKTLLDLGVDYDTAISFIMQPAITIINDAYFESNSLYINSFGNPIDSALKNIAIRLGIEYNNKPVDKYTPINYVKNAIKEHKGLKEYFNKLGVEDIFKTDYVLDKRANSKRLSNPINSSLIEDIALDFMNIMIFDNLNTISNNIEKILNVSKPDRYGARQTIRETRKTVEEIENFSSIKNSIGNTLLVPVDKYDETTKEITKTYVPIVSALFEEIADNDENILYNSFYPYLNSFYKYSTKPSVVINKLLFDLESNNYVKNEKLLEKLIGRELTNDEYKQFKQYIVASTYRVVELLEKPITINDKGFVVIDEERLDEYSANDNGYDAAEKERFRIYGYEQSDTKPIVLEDFDSPNEEELYRFNTLSPAEKLLWVKENFKENAGIFEMLNVRTFNYNEYKEKGYNTSIITYADSGKDSDQLIAEFNNKYHSKHPFVKLAMIDLVKYAFYVEGFNFKTGNISKIVSNKAMLDLHLPNGLNIIDIIKNTISDNTERELAEINERFIRSHSTIVPNIEIKKGSDLEKGFLQSTILNDLYGLSIEEGASEYVSNFIERLTNGKQELPNYVRITREENKNKVTKLYKVVFNDNGNFYRYVYLYPLNLLESKETHETSSNINNNLYRPETYYKELIDLNEGLQYRLKEYNISGSKADQADPTIKEKLIELKNKHKIKNYEFDKIVSTLENPNTLIELSNSEDRYLATEVKTFMKRIDDAVKNKKGEFRLISYPGFKVKGLFEAESESNLSIPYKLNILGEDGKTYPVIISKYKMSKNAYKILKDKDYKGNAVISYEENLLINDIKINKDGFIQCYKIEPIINQELQNELKQTVNNTKEKLAATGSIYDEYDVEVNTNEFPELTTITKKIIDNIKYNKRNAVLDQRDMFVNRLDKGHVDSRSLISIYDNNELIFRSIAEYYRTVTTKLLSDINEFKASNGETYSIGDKELYEYLAKDDKDYARVVDILLRARNIGESLKELFQINLDSETKIVKDYINNIQKYINSIIQNTSVREGFNNIFNIYFAKKYSNNPNVKNGLVLLTEQFGDATKADLLLSDVEELNNKQVQAVAKMVYSIVSEAEQVTGPKAAIEFEKAFDNILNKDGELDFDHIIDKTGRFVMPFTEEFAKDKRKWYEESVRIRETYGTRSKEYLDFKLQYDKWKLANTHQELEDDYYREKIAIEEELYDKAQDLYLKFINLKNELDELSDDANEPEDIIRKRNLKQLYIKDLFSYHDEFGQSKSKAEIDKIIALKNYFAKKNILEDKYFTKKVNKEFLDLVNYYEDIIKVYDKTNSDKTLDEKLQNDTYKNAYYWLASNGYYNIVGEAKDKIIESFDLLKNQNNPTNDILHSFLKSKNRYDIYGTIDGRNFTKEEVETLRKNIELNFNVEDYSEADATLIKDVPEDENVYNKEYYNLFVSKLTPEQKGRKRAIQFRINQILAKGFGTDNHLSSKLLFENCTIEELTELAGYYKELRGMSSTMTKEQVRRLNKEIDFKTNDSAFATEDSYYKLNLINDKTKAKLWKEIFLDWQFDEFGNYQIRLEDGIKRVPNRFIYGYALPKEKYINKAKTEAKKFINENVEFITTEYYKIAEKEAIRENRYEEWFKENHVYNPYARKWQPLPIWTKMGLNPNSRYKDDYQFVPKADNIDKKPKKINEKYLKVPYNYKEGNYDSNINLSDKEKEMLKLLRDTIQTFTFDGKAQEFADRGYVPRRYKSIEDKEFYIRQAIGAVGLDYKSHKYDEFYDNFDFNNDEEISFNMLEFIKGKGYKNTIKLLDKLKGETETEWKERNKDRIEYNEKVKAENLRIDNELLDRDWRSVFHDFVVNATIYEARNKVKDSLYLLLQSLKDNKAFDVNAFGKVKTTKHSAKELVDYKMTEQNNYYAVVENWARRLIHSQFKEKSRFRDIADFMQNVTSAKYMILNVTGGIANVTTGLTNIMGENFAKDYFGGAEFKTAQKRYAKNITNYIVQMYSDTSDDYDVALTKYFDVVDFDAMLERKPSNTVGEKIARGRDLLYSLQAGGEHYMQNSVLYAMLQSTRIYEEDGKQVIGSFAEYINNIEKKALLSVIGEDKNLITAYKYYISEIKSDANKKKDIDSFNYDAYVDFAKTYFSRKQLEEFAKVKKEFTKNAKIEFDKLPTVESQLVHENGRIELKDGALIKDIDLQEFRRKVISVNKLIHGVYDKYGAARLERKWYGSLIMQYHKHLYPGIMKRYRGLFGSGYYNELRGGVAYGSYVSLGKFIATDFRRLNFKDDKGEFIGVLNSIKNVAQATYDSIVNISLNWSTMAEWEKRNCRRALGDLAGVAAALLSAILLHALTDDDELKDSDLLSTSLYLIDRLNSESSMYTPWGMFTEFKTLYSSPIAMSNLPTDILKCLELSVQWMFNDNFDINYPSGLYSGENKIWVRLRRNIPGYRVYDRLNHMANNNQYYRIGDNNWNIKLAKSIGNFIDSE